MSRSPITTKNLIPLGRDRFVAPPIGPGMLLLNQFLIPMGMTQSAFAKIVGISTAYISDIVKGRRGISAEMALRFEAALGVEAQFWLNAQNTVDLYQAEQNQGEAAKREAIYAKVLEVGPLYGASLRGEAL